MSLLRPVPASLDAGEGTYPECKRSAELAIVRAFGERALPARPGLILGAHENLGRPPWWLNRVAAGGEVLAPGPAGLELQYIDARDLAGFVLDACAHGLGGPFNVVSRRGHATMGSLLQACLRVAGSADARLTWLSPEALLEAGIQPWTELRSGSRPSTNTPACTPRTSNAPTRPDSVAGRCRTPSPTPGSGSRASVVRRRCAPTFGPRA